MRRGEAVLGARLLVRKPGPMINNGQPVSAKAYRKRSSHGRCVQFL